MDPRPLERRLVLQLAEHQLLRLAERLEQTKAGHLAQVADHRRHRHPFEQRFPNQRLVEPLGRDGLAWQVEIMNEFHNFTGQGGALGLLECLDELWQFPHRIVLGDSIFPTNFALHLAFTERIRTRKHPAEDRVMLAGGSLRMGEAEQVAVRPAIALLVLHGLVGKVAGPTIHVPVANRIAETAAPTAHGVHVFREVKKVCANAADLVQIRECVSFRRRVTVGHHQCQSENRRLVLGRAAGRTDCHDLVHRAEAISLDAANECVVILLHEFVFGEVISASLRAEDQEAVEPRPVIHRPHISTVRVANLGRARNRLRLRCGAAVEDFCVINCHVSLPFIVCAANSPAPIFALNCGQVGELGLVICSDNPVLSARRSVCARPMRCARLLAEKSDSGWRRHNARSGGSSS